MAKKTNFLVHIVEDDDWYRDFLGHVISLNPEYEVKKFATAKDFLAGLQQRPNVVTLDYHLPDMEGEKVLHRIKDVLPDTQVIIISEQEKIDTALGLLKQGAYDYLVKTPDIKERLLNTLNNIRDNQELKEKVVTLEKEVHAKYDFTKMVVGQSEAMEKIFHLLQKATQTNITVSLFGETGTGKEVVAKAIHFNSRVKNGPFIAVNMAAIPKDLVESELFGHEKGAFTGAALARAGKFEEASGGTIFLDEIGEMELSLQVKLLRVLQEKEVTRVGSNKVIGIDCRIITATNRNLADDVSAGRFREDLYYRLLGLQINLPPLRERGNDILLLAKYFIDNFCKENKLEKKTLSDAAKKKLMNYIYPGNVRELRSVIELAVAMSDSLEIGEHDIMFSEARGLMDNLLREEVTLAEYEKRIIYFFLKKYNDNVLDVAARLDIGKSTIYKMLKEDEEKVKAKEVSK